MTIRPPTRDEVEAVAADLGLVLAADDAAELTQLCEPLVLANRLLDEVPEALPEVRYPRTPGARPAPEDNPFGAWYVKTRVAGAATGKLAGRTAVLKDNVMLAGVPMMNGTALLDGYVPPVDATVATRILDAGGTIVGKAVCESFCFSGGSHTSDTGPVRNPRDPSRHAGGSSSGSAALLAAGEVDLAIGGDQGGSIRMPSSFCGTVGMKPTHGLVPYTGILSMEPTIDHAGPMTANVADNALLLEVIAGADGFDGRQYAPRVDAYTESLGRGVEGLRMAVLREGFGLPTSEPDVDAAVREAARTFETLGAKVDEVSIPEHRLAGALLGPVFQAAIVQMFHTDGMGVGREDLFVASLADRMRGWRERADELPDTAQVFLLATEINRRRYGWRYYAKAMNQIRRVRAAYDTVLQEIDVLLLPTTPMKAPPLPAPDAPRAQVLAEAMDPTANTLPFDHTHHPALSIPCGDSDGLPVGLMLVGRAWEEATLYRAADAFESRR